MSERLEPKLHILPDSQKQLWPQLRPAPGLGFVLYGGTAVALRLGHRQSIDFGFFRSESLAKQDIATAFSFMPDAKTIQDEVNTLVVIAKVGNDEVKVSFFGGMKIGRINDPSWTADSMLLIASLDDLLATKLKTILDRAEAKDYRDIAAMLAAGASLERALEAFTKMYNSDAALPLKALCYFKDGALTRLSQSDQDALRAARTASEKSRRLLSFKGYLRSPDFLESSSPICLPIQERLHHRIDQLWVR